MKDIKAILTEHLPEIEAETLAAITADVKANYKTVSEWTKKVERISELEEANAALADRASKVEGDSAEIEELKAEIARRDEAEAKRQADEAEAAKRDAFSAAFEEALGDRKFANDLMRETVFDRAYRACSDNTAKGVMDALDELTKDVPGVWLNPQRDPMRMPTAGQISSTKQQSAEERSFFDALFGPKQ